MVMDAAAERESGKRRKSHSLHTAKAAVDADTSEALRHAQRRYDARRSIRQSLGIATSPSPPSFVLPRGDEESLRYGFDREVHDTLRKKQDFELEWDVCDWMESLLRVPIDDFYTSTRSGVLLCRLANAIRRDSIASINEKAIAMFEMENIRHFLGFCRGFGMSDWELFDAKDLYTASNLPHVVRSIHSFARRVSSEANYSGPRIVHRRPMINVDEGSVTESGTQDELDDLRPVRTVQKEGGCCSSCVLC